MESDPGRAPGVPSSHVPGSTGLHVTAEEVARRKEYLQITGEDEQRLHRAHDIIQRHVDTIISEFYDYLLSHPHTRKILEVPGVLERLRTVQRAYFDRLTRGPYDQSYFEDRLRTGYAHDRIGLSPEWYLGAYHKYLSIVSEVLSRELHEYAAQFSATLVSLTKIIYLDMGLAMDAYIDAGQRRLKDRNRLLEELDAKKQLLTDTIVHDLRNPVAGIQAFLSVFRLDAPKLTESHRSAIDEAERACSMLNTMVDNVLAISRMEEGRLDVRKDEVELRALVEQVAQALRPFAVSRGKVLRTRLGDFPLLAHTDAGLVQRILLNLVMNSIRHAAGASFVEIEAGRDASGRMRLAVADDGPGIPRQYHSFIFEKYGRSNLRKAGLKLDTGLGLVFCRMAANELGAEVVLDSDEGKGARFALVL